MVQTFHYRAVTEASGKTEGTLQAESRQAAVEELESRGLFPIEIAPQEEAKGKAARFLRGVSRKEVTAFSRALADLLRAGITLDGALAILIREAPRPAVTEMLQEIRGTLGGGAPLSDALAARPDLFGNLMVHMVRAGEEGGFLADCLDRVASFMEKREALAGKIKEAMVYPAILCVLGAATVFYLLTFFIPRFSQLFADLGASLPKPTLVLLAISGFLGRWWPALLVVLVGGAAALVRGLATPAGKLLQDRLLLRVPLASGIVTRSALARLARTLGTLLASGVPMLRSLDIAGKATGNGVYEQAAARVREKVQEGTKLGAAMEGEPLLPPSFRGRVAVGEESGSLDTILLAMADSYEAAVDRAVKAFVTAMEPVLICLLAGVVGFIVIAMLLPIFTLSKAIKAH